MKLKIYSLVFFIGSLLSLPTIAQRVISADLTYAYVSGETYEFTLNVYRDCSNLSFLQSTYNVTYYSKNCSNKSGTFDVNFVKKVKLSAACPTKTSFCDGGDQPG
ncbi:MAG: hypothetical protein K2Q22_12275, partial [Cytophagales bacterium]|nr:hypothetical protein [Cytophagales bacterium]